MTRLGLQRRLQFAGRRLKLDPLAPSKGGGVQAVYPIDDVGGAAPQIAYGPVKLRSAYAGPSCRIVRLSDSAEMDIGFAGQGIDDAARQAFDPAGTGQILRWYDQSGNGNHSDVQATASDRHVFSALKSPAGHRYVTGNGVYEFPLTTSWSTRAISAYSFTERNLQPTTTEGLFEFPGGVQQIAGSGVGDQTGTVGGVRRRSGLVVSELLTRTGAVTINNHGDIELAAGSPTLAQVSGGRVGNDSVSYGSKALNLAWIAYPRTLDTTERGLIKDALKKMEGLPLVTSGVLVFSGDSITNGSDGTEGFGYRGIAQREFAGLKCYSIAAGGSQLGPTPGSTLLGLFPTGGALLLDQFTSGLRIFTCMIGTNDIASGRSAAAIYADYINLAGQVKAKGFKFLACTQTPDGSNNSTLRAARADFNLSVRTNWASFADALWDAAMHPVMGDLEAPAPYYTDKLHPTPLGHTLLAPGYIAAVKALM